MKHPSHLLDSLFTNTHSLPPPNPLRFPPSQNWPASCQAKTVCLPSVSLHQSLLTSPTFLPIHPSIFFSTLQPQYTILHPTHPAPLSLNSFGLRKQTKKSLCPGRKRWCVTQRGDNASAGSTQSQASSLGLCLCLSDKLSWLYFHWGTKYIT